MSRLIFVVFFALILFGIAFFTAKIFSKGFRMNHPSSTSVIIAALLVPLFFIGNLIMSRSSEFASPVVYTIINTVAGITLFLFIGSLVLGLALLIAYITHTALPLYVPWIILVLSLALGIGGFIQAKYYTIREYTVTLPNALASWNDKTAVLVADTHFGLTNHVKFSNKVVDRILALNPDFVLHAGDFYDGPHIDTAPITSSWKRLTAALPVFYAPGNHEGYGEYNIFIQSARDAGITVLDDKKVTYDGIAIAGIIYRGGKESPEATAAIASLALENEPASILINHPPHSLEAAHQNGVDMMVSGHTHNGQFWPMTHLIKKIYAPYHHGLHAYKDMQVLTTSGIGTYGPAIRLFNTPELVLIRFKTK